ncbi:MAG: hypothetical protein F6K65_24435 [Moorea sp. SIO3C2]|nr:hypothetical protein [Moorena sp. SIO3C2]
MTKSKGLALVSGFIKLIIICSLIQPMLVGCTKPTENLSKADLNQEIQPTENLVKADLNQEIQLHIDQMALMASKTMQVKVLDIVEDSRCPVDVVCVQPGQVTIAFEVIKENSQPEEVELTLRAAQENLAVKNFDGYSMTLKNVEPLPMTNQEKIIQSDYIVTIVVSKS